MEVSKYDPDDNGFDMDVLEDFVEDFEDQYPGAVILASGIRGDTLHLLAVVGDDAGAPEVVMAHTEDDDGVAVYDRLDDIHPAPREWFRAALRALHGPYLH